MKTHASCCCGAMSIELSGDIKLSALCHCENCRRRTGSAFGYSLYFQKNAIHVNSSQASSYLINNEDGKQERHFCSICGSTLFWLWDRFPDWVGVAGGCITNAIPEPSISACHNQKSDWLSIPDTWRFY
jgi:hypothetical protein